MKKQSIRQYLFKTVVTTLLIISLIMFVLNLIFADNIRTDYIYHELEEAMDYDNLAVRLDSKTAYVNVFSIIGKKDDYVIEDKNIKDKNKFDPHIYTTIADDYFKHEEDEGRVYSENKKHFYITENIDGGVRIYMVAIEKVNYVIEILLVLTLIMTTVYIVSLKISKYISIPVEQLSLYSEEIAKKNWKVQLDPINNLELSRLGDDLIEMKAHLERADEEERQFLQATSHDLKTPIMIIKGYIQAMLDGVPIDGELLPSEVLLQETERLERKVNQLVHLNTIGYTLENKHNFESISINRIIKHLAEKLNVINKDIEIHIEEESMECFGDGDALRIAFENILENQLRYAHSAITISIKNHVIKISNDGPHFEQSPEEMFEIYKKGKSGKFGLGLAITKKVIDAHQGDIKAYNLEVGICFEIELQDKTPF